MDLSPSKIFTRENQYQFWGIDCQSYFSLKHGFKPVIRIQIEESLREPFQKSWKELGFHVLIEKFTSVFYGQKIKSPVFLGYLSLNRVLARKAFEADKIGDRMMFGKLLGYPSCCVKNFVDSFGRTGPDLIVGALISAKGKPSFYCNPIFNFESKLSSEETKIFSDSDKIFSKSRHLFLIKHSPCSLDCRQSINLGKKTLEILKKEMPELASELAWVLKKPVLYFDYFNWLVFDGEVKGNQLKYRQILPYPSLFPEEKSDLIKKGDQLIIREKEIVVLKGKKPVGKIKKDDKRPGVLIDFQ